MAKFQSKTQAGLREKPPVGEVSSALELQETFLPEEPAPRPAEPELRPISRDEADGIRKMRIPTIPKRGPGRPSEGVKGFAARMNPETIAAIKSLAEGLRLRSEGKAIERAVAFYRAHLIAKTRKELDLGSDVDDEAVILKAFKVDD